MINLTDTEIHQLIWRVADDLTYKIYATHNEDQNVLVTYPASPGHGRQRRVAEFLLIKGPDGSEVLDPDGKSELFCAIAAGLQNEDYILARTSLTYEQLVLCTSRQARDIVWRRWQEQISGRPIGHRTRPPLPPLDVED